MRKARKLQTQTVRITLKTHTKLKVLAALEDENINDLAEQILSAALTCELYRQIPDFMADVE